jgi:hypothetical protein
MNAVFSREAFVPMKRCTKILSVTDRDSHFPPQRSRSKCSRHALKMEREGTAGQKLAVRISFSPPLEVRLAHCREVKCAALMAAPWAEEDLPSAQQDDRLLHPWGGRDLEGRSNELEIAVLPQNEAQKLTAGANFGRKPRDCGRSHTYRELLLSHRNVALFRTRTLFL